MKNDPKLHLDDLADRFASGEPHTGKGHRRNHLSPRLKAVLICLGIAGTAAFIVAVVLVIRA